MKNNDFWSNLIGTIAEELIVELFLENKSESKQKYKEQETQDLGYAVIVADDEN
jgi:hypothetical protein